MNRKEVNLVKQKVYSFVSTQFFKIPEVLKMLSLTTTEYNEIEDYVTRYHEQPVEVARFLSDNPEFIKFLPHDDHRINMILMIISLSEFPVTKYFTEDDRKDHDICKALVSKFPCDIKYVNQTEELCILAVRQNALALEHVNNKTKEVCEEAVMKDPKAIQFVPKCEYYKELVELAETFSKNTSSVSWSNGGNKMRQFKDINEIKNFINNASIIEVASFLDEYPEYMKYVDGTRRKDIIMIMIFTSPVIIGNRFTQSDLSDPDIALAMVCNYPYSIRDVRQTEELCLSAVRKDGMTLEFIRAKTRSVCLEAIVQCPWALKFVPTDAEFYSELAELAVKIDGDTIKLVDKKWQTEEMCRHAIFHNPRNIEYVYVESVIEEYVSTLIRENPELIWMFPDQCVSAVTSHGEAISTIHPSLRTEDVCRAALFSTNVDDIIPFIPSTFKNTLVKELVDKILFAAEKDSSSEYYGFCASYGSDEYDEDDICDDDCDNCYDEDIEA